jgi:hypothetical protein
VPLKSNLDVQQTHLWGRFVEQKLILSSNFRCGKIDKINCYEFGHTFIVLLKYDSDVQQTTSWGQFFELKLVLSSIFYASKNRNARDWFWSHFVVLLKAVEQTYGTTLKTLHYHNLEMGPISLSF